MPYHHSSLRPVFKTSPVLLLAAAAVASADCYLRLLTATKRSDDMPWWDFNTTGEAVVHWGDDGAMWTNTLVI